MKIIKLGLLVLIGTIGLSTLNIQAAAYPEEELDWVKIEKGTTPQLGWTIRNFSYIPIEIRYTQNDNNKNITKVLNNNEIMDINPQITGNVTIKILPNMLRQVLENIPVSLHLIGATLGISSKLAAISKLQEIISQRTNQTIILNPTNYTPGSIIMFYWPIFLMATGIEPQLISLESVEAVEAIQAVTDWLYQKSIVTYQKGQEVYQKSSYALHKGYNIISDFIKEKAQTKKAVTNQDIKNLQSSQLAPITKILEQYEIFEDYEQPQ